MSELSQPISTASSPKTTINIGDVPYDIDLSKIPYLSSFVDFQTKALPPSTELEHGPIPLFDVALKGIESGYHQCFRSLPADLSQHRILCDTYDFLRVGILGGQSIDEIIRDLKSGQSDHDHEERRQVKGDKSKARDTAYKLLNLILQREFTDETRYYTLCRTRRLSNGGRGA